MAEENTPEPGELPKQEPSTDEPSAESTARADVSGVVPSKQVPMTPGQRLAAKKAQKAVDKRESRDERKRAEEEARQKEQQEAERLLGRAQPGPALPENVEKVAGTFSHTLQDNRERILLALGGLVLLTLIGIGAQRLLSSGKTEQAAQLGEALDFANAPLDPEDKDGQTDDGKPVFKSDEERAKKALAAFEQVVKADDDRPAAAWAKLGGGVAQVRLGQFEEARARFQDVYDAHTSEPTLAARALEGSGIALEAAGKLDEAQKRFELLKGIEGSKELAEFHLARLKLAKGDQEGAKQMLKALYDQLSTPAEGSAPSPYLKAEVEVRLAELDSTLVDKGRFGDAPQQFTEEQLQRLIEQMQKRGAGQPGAGGE